MNIRYDKNRKSYCIIHKRKTIMSYSKSAYGHYAKKLALLSLETGIRYNNYFKIKKNHAVIKIFSNTYGYYNIKIDIDQLEKVLKFRWKIAMMNGVPYCNAMYKNKNGKQKVMQLHRFVMDVDSKKLVVDHINHDTLDNRRKNLRVVSQKVNLRNMKRKSDNSVWVGVTATKNKEYLVSYRDKNSKKHSKYFSIKKYGKEEALKLAIICSITKRYENGYLLQDEDMKFLEENNIKLFKRIKVKKIK